MKLVDTLLPDLETGIQYTLKSIPKLIVHLLLPSTHEDYELGKKVNLLSMDICRKSI